MIGALLDCGVAIARTVATSTAADWAQVATGAASVGVGGLAFAIAVRQWRSEERQQREAGAREAVDRFFSEQLAEIRFSLFDLINQIARAAHGEPGQAFDTLREEFEVGPQTANLPSRYELSVRWGVRPPKDQRAREVRDQFERQTAIICATFDAILKAAEDSAEAAAHVQRRMGRLLVWWMLFWPGAFDHSRSFTALTFVSVRDVAACDPSDRSCDAYTARFHETPLWTEEQWRGAIENYDAIPETMFPADARSVER